MTKYIVEDNFYRSLFEHNPDIVFYVDKEGVIAKANQNLSFVMGYSAEDVSTALLINYLPKHEQDHYYKNFLDALNGEPRTIETLFIHANGNHIPIHMVMIPAIVEGKVTGVFIMAKDKSEIQKIESSLHKSELKFKGIVEEALVGVYMLKDNHVLYANPYYYQLVGTESPEFLTYVHPEDRSEVQCVFSSLKEGEKGITHYFRIVSNNGSVLKMEAHSKLIIIDHEPIIMGTVIDITEREETWKKINFLAYFDQLTELPNRKSFEESLEKEVANAAKLNQRLAIMYLDLDRFKYINDTFGHRVGDELLVEISLRLRGVLGDGNKLYRISGDEFAIISPNFNTKCEVIDLATRLIGSMKEQFLVGPYRLFMTTSIGISLFPEDGEDTISLMKNADAALHIAKREGKNNYRIYSTMDIRTFKTFKLGADIHEALEKDQLEYYFQPKVSMEDNKIVGAEALIRWNHPEWGVLSPNEFLPVIEEHGLTSEVGRLMNRKAAKQIKAWQEIGLAKIPISVNLSANQFLDQNLVGSFKEILTDTGVEPRFMEIEITETSMLENEEIVLETLTELIEMGMAISLDDFGTGYSSLSYLTKFKKYIDTLKLDRSFITHLSPDEDDESNFITKTIINIAERMKISVVAEGVETYDQYYLLKEMGCKIVQGYLFSKPVSAAEFEELLKKETINIPHAHKLEKQLEEERRKGFRIPLQYPLRSSMTLSRIKSRKVEVGKTIVFIDSIGLGGLRFLTDMRLTVYPNIIYELEFVLFGETIKLLGSIIWIEEIKPDVYQYGLEYAISESVRKEITPILDKLASGLRKDSILPNCSFATENRSVIIDKLHQKVNGILNV